MTRREAAEKVFRYNRENKKDFNNLIDMFEISTKIKTNNMTVEDFTGIEEADIFDRVVL